MSSMKRLKYPAELRQRAVSLVLDEKKTDPSGSARGLYQKVGDQLGISPDTLRTWVFKAEVDAGVKPGVTSEESAELKRLKKENVELKRVNAILKTSAVFFAAELDRPRI